MDLSEELLRQVALDTAGSTVVEFQGQRIDFSHIRRMSLHEAVIEHWKDGERPTLEQLKDAEWLKWRSTKGTPGEAVVDLFERYAEAELIQPTIIYDYPVETFAALQEQAGATPAWWSASRCTRPAWKSPTPTPS